MHSPCELTQLCTVTPRRAPGETCQVHTVQRSRSSDEFGFTHYISGIFVRSQVLINQNLGSYVRPFISPIGKYNLKSGGFPEVCAEGGVSLSYFLLTLSPLFPSTPSSLLPRLLVVIVYLLFQTCRAVWGAVQNSRSLSLRLTIRLRFPPLPMFFSRDTSHRMASH